MQYPQQHQGDFDDVRHGGIMMAAMIALGGFFATRGAGIIPYIGWAFVLAAVAAIIRELVSYGNIGHNLIALALATVPVVIWYEVEAGFSLSSFARHLFLIGIVLYMGMVMVKSLKPSRPDDSSEGSPTNEPET